MAAAQSTRTRRWYGVVSLLARVTKGIVLEEQHRRRIDIVNDPAFTADIQDISLEALRERRHMCDDLDTELSYYRRLLHGRMDLLSFEIRRRRGEETRELIDALPEILADNDASSHEPRQLVARSLPVEPPDLPAFGRREIDHVLGDDFLARLPTLDDAELEDIQASLTEVEAEISTQRRSVYDAHEKIHEELTRRYRDGLASVDELLSS